MKIKLIDIEPNPFRILGKYPLSKTKIDSLRKSIKQNGYWGGIVLRKHPTKKNIYQAAFGHHRLQALKSAKITEIKRVIVLELNNDQMFRYMHDENQETWGIRPEGLLECVESARKYLDAILEKYEDWNHVGEKPNMKRLFGSNSQFMNCKKAGGVGRGIVNKFLGGLCTEERVRKAFTVLNEQKEPNNKVSFEAIRQLPSITHVENFRNEVKRFETPKPIQEEIAKKIVDEQIGKRGVADIVAEFSPPIPNLKKRKIKVKSLPNIAEYVFKLESDTFDINRRLKALVPEMEILANEGRLLGRLMPALTKLNKTIEGVIEDYDKARKETKKMAVV